MHRIPKAWSPYLIALLMGLSMGVVMSFVMTLVNVGFTDDFVLKWLRAFGIGASIGIPTALIVGPVITKLVNKMID